MRLDRFAARRVGHVGQAAVTGRKTADRCKAEVGAVKRAHGFGADHHAQAVLLRQLVLGRAGPFAAVALPGLAVEAKIVLMIDARLGGRPGKAQVEVLVIVGGLHAEVDAGALAFDGFGVEGGMTDEPFTQFRRMRRRLARMAFGAGGSGEQARRAGVGLSHPHETWPG